MSRKPDDLELLCIHELANSNSKVQELINDKNKEVYDIGRTQNITYKKPDPAPKPSGDIRLSKNYKKDTRSKENMEKLVVDTKNNFDKQIKQEMDSLVEHPDQIQIKSIVQDMNPQELAIVSEKGADAYRQHEKEQTGDKDVLDLKMDDEKSKEIFGDFEVEQEITTLEEKEITHDIEIEEVLKMTNEESEKTFNYQQELGDFKDNSKDIIVNKNPSPSDEFE